jgi:hypothetical protein
VSTSPVFSADVEPEADDALDAAVELDAAELVFAELLDVLDEPHPVNTVAIKAVTVINAKILLFMLIPPP